MKKIGIILIILFSSICFSPLSAGPFLKIDRVDAVSESPVIKIFLTVRNSDNTAISGLNEENILVFEDDYRVNYVRVKDLSESDGLLYMVYAIDSSKSITEELLGKLKDEAERLLGSSGTDDMTALYKFNDKVELLNNFTSNRAELQKNIEKIERHGTKTLLYDAIYSSINLLNMSDVSRKAVIVFTDGKDEGSSIEIDDIVDIARQTSVPVYCVSLKSDENTRILTRISKLTGGMHVFIGDRDIVDIYRTILSNINRQYLVEYHSMIEADGGVHTLEVRLKYGDLRDFARKEITIKRSFFLPHISLSSDTILIVLVVLIVIILLILSVYIIKRNSGRQRKPPEIITQHGVTATDECRDEEPCESLEGEEDSDEGLVYSKTWLVERDGKEAGRKIPVDSEEFTIGSDPANSLVIREKYVSPSHAKLKRIKRAYYIFDLASDSGTFLNENKLLRPRLLYDWDEIRVGKRIFIFRGTNIA